MFLVSCRCDAWAMPDLTNSEVVQGFYDQWNRGVIDFDQLFTDDVTNHQPDVEPETGLGKFREAIAGVMSAVPDSNWTTLRLLECDDIVVCHNRWSGTFGGTVFRGIPTSAGNRFSVEHIHIYRMAEGRIAEHWVVRDDLGMLMQVRANIAGP
jgi:predicted ester cyclase